MKLDNTTLILYKNKQTQSHLTVWSFANYLHRYIPILLLLLLFIPILGYNNQLYS